MTNFTARRMLICAAQDAELKSTATSKTRHTKRKLPDDSESWAAFMRLFGRIQ